MDSSFYGYIKDFLLVCVWPVVALLGKKIIGRADNLERIQQEHTIRISVAEANLKNLNDDIYEIKQSIDKLPERIKADIRDLINGRD